MNVLDSEKGQLPENPSPVIRVSGQRLPFGVLASSPSCADSVEGVSNPCGQLSQSLRTTFPIPADNFPNALARVCASVGESPGVARSRCGLSFALRYGPKGPSGRHSRTLPARDLAA